MAPLYAAFLASVAGSKLVTDFNSFLYVQPDDAFQDVVLGDNSMGFVDRGFVAGAGWDPCTGRGRVIGPKVADELRKVLADRP